MRACPAILFLVVINLVDNLDGMGSDTILSLPLMRPFTSSLSSRCFRLTFRTQIWYMSINEYETINEPNGDLHEVILLTAVTWFKRMFRWTLSMKRPLTSL